MKEIIEEYGEFLMAIVGFSVFIGVFLLLMQGPFGQTVSAWAGRFL